MKKYAPIAAPEIEVVETVIETVETILVRNRQTGFEVHMPLEQWNAYGDAERDSYLVL